MRQAQLLKGLGFDNKTESVYRALLNLGDAPASAIARKAGVIRTSAYHILESLIFMGLVSSYIERGVRRFAAENPSKLKTFFDRQSILAERIIPEFEKEIKRRHLPSGIKLYEGKEALRGLTELALKTKEKQIFSVGSTKRLLEFMGGKYGFGKQRQVLDITQRALRFLGDESKNSMVRILPDSFDFPGYILFFDTSVIIIPFSEPARGYLISDVLFSRMMQSMFEVLWNSRD